LLHKVIPAIATDVTVAWSVRLSYLCSLARTFVWPKVTPC